MILVASVAAQAKKPMLAIVFGVERHSMFVA